MVLPGRQAHCAIDGVHDRLRLQREHGADPGCTPFNEEGRGRHNDALRDFLLAEHIERERTELR